MRGSSQAVTGEDITWGQFFDRSADEAIVEEMTLYKKAQEAGYELEETDKMEVENYIRSMQMQVGKPVDFELYLESLYGKGFSVASFQRILERQALISNYMEAAPATYEISDEEIEKNYENDPSLYDLVTYNSFTLVTPQKNSDDSDMTTEEKAKSKEDTEKLAEEITEKIESPEDILEQAKANASEDDQEKFEGDEDVTLVEDATKRQVPTTDMQNWLFDKERKEGDTKYFAVGNNFEIVYFGSRTKDTRQTTSFSVSTFSLKNADGSDREEEEIEETRKAASDLADSLKTAADVTAYDVAVAKPNEIKAAKAVTHEEINGAGASGIDRKVLHWALSEDAKEGTARAIETDSAIHVVLITERQDTESWYVQNKLYAQHSSFNEDMETWSKEAGEAVQRVYPGYWLIP